MNNPRPAARKASQAIDLKPLLERFVHEDDLDWRLFEVALSAARSCLLDASSQFDAEAQSERCKDLALDFLIFYIRAQNKCSFRTQAALKREMMRYLVRTQDPEGYELWSLLSEALHALAREGKARRLDAKPSEPNNNSALWTSAAPRFDKKKLEITVFESNAKAIGFFYPLQQHSGESKSGGGTSKRTILGHRIIQPSSAKSLLEQLLKAAQGPIMFTILLEEAKRHVALLSKFTSLQLEEEGSAARQPIRDLGDLYSDYKSWADSEAARRSCRIWRRINEADLGELLCLYYLPKFFLQQKIAMKRFGKPQRVSEQAEQIRRILEEELSVERLSVEHEGEREACFRLAWREMIAKTASRLMKQYSEKP